MVWFVKVLDFLALPPALPSPRIVSNPPVVMPSLFREEMEIERREYEKMTRVKIAKRHRPFAKRRLRKVKAVALVSGLSQKPTPPASPGYYRT